MHESSGTFSALHQTSLMPEWKEYFSSLLNGTPVVVSPSEIEWGDLDINLGPINEVEVAEAINKILYG